MFDFDAGKERLSILSKYVRLPRSAEHGEVTASLLYERLVMAAIAASKTEEDLGRIFSFSWDTVRYLTNMNLSNDDFAKLTLAIFDRRPIPCLFVQQKTGDWFEMPMICAIECGEDAGVHFRLNEFFIKTCVPGGRRRAASAASLYGVCPYPTDSIRCSQGHWRPEKWSFRLRGSERFSISAKKNLSPIRRSTAGIRTCSGRLFAPAVWS